MTTQEFYKQLETKGYSNGDIQEAVTNYFQDANSLTQQDLDTHIKGVLELDARAVFALWYSDGTAAAKLDTAYTEWKAGQIDYMVDYIIKGN